MKSLGCLCSLVVSVVLCIVELYKVEAVLDAENRRTSLYNTCDRINRLAGIEFKLIILLLAAQVFYLTYTSFLIVSLLVYEVKGKESEGYTVSALDFFKRKKVLKVEMFCKIVLHAFFIYKYFIDLIVAKG